MYGDVFGLGQAVEVVVLQAPGFRRFTPYPPPELADVAVLLGLGGDFLASQRVPTNTLTPSGLEGMLYNIFFSFSPIYITNPSQERMQLDYNRVPFF